MEDSIVTNLRELSIPLVAIDHNPIIKYRIIHFKNYSKFINYLLIKKILPLTKRRDGKEVSASCRVKSPEVT